MQESASKNQAIPAKPNLRVSFMKVSFHLVDISTHYPDHGRFKVRIGWKGVP